MREISQLEKKSMYTLRLTGDIKDQVVQSHLNELSKIVKTQVKRKKLVILVVEENLVLRLLWW